MKRWLLVLPIFASMAHVGSPDAFFSGFAGPYQVRVVVRLPGVIPGLAQISVRVVGVAPEDVHSVTVQAVQWNVGADGAPAPDRAARVPGDAELYAADLWFMVPTSYRVKVAVDGRRGSGTAVVPVVAAATAEGTMSRHTGVVLAGLGVFLAIGLLTIVGAAVRESVLPPGAVPDASRLRRARVAKGLAAVVVGVAVWGGNAWWRAEAAGYRAFSLYRPLQTEARVGGEGHRRILSLAIRDPRFPENPPEFTRYNRLMPDHGKLMHLFLIREPLLDAFAHLHPVARTPTQHDFDTLLPALPEGRYRVYADVVHESGFAQTLVAAAHLAAQPLRQGSTDAVAAGPQDASDAPADPDDSWAVTTAMTPVGQSVFKFGDGTSVVFALDGRPIEGAEVTLNFAARDASGAPLTLEPYMGMAAHVVVTNEAGDVFVHLHPSGTVSMAALQKFEAADGVIASSADHAAHAMPSPTPADISIPYAFPKAGRYRLWVQMKRDGQVFTSAFDVVLAPAAGS